jgi:hypothetical protein
MYISRFDNYITDHRSHMDLFKIHKRAYTILISMIRGVTRHKPANENMPELCFGRDHGNMKSSVL